MKAKKRGETAMQAKYERMVAKKDADAKKPERKKKLSPYQFIAVAWWYVTNTERWALDAVLETSQERAETVAELMQLRAEARMNGMMCDFRCASGKVELLIPALTITEPGEFPVIFDNVHHGFRAEFARSLAVLRSWIPAAQEHKVEELHFQSWMENGARFRTKRVRKAKPQVPQGGGRYGGKY